MQKDKSKQMHQWKKQREMYCKEEAASPTVSLLASIIDTAKERDATTTDIPVAHLNADMDNTVIMVTEKQLVELMMQTAPELFR
eukprot:13120105-Ditylum_brightwellii.AAC.1